MREDRRGTWITGEASTADWKPADDVVADDDELASLDDDDDSEDDTLVDRSSRDSGEGVV